LLARRGEVEDFLTRLHQHTTNVTFSAFLEIVEVSRV